ncbi:MAG: AI-2E family transporter [Calditrichaceae bacterium]|nr:AI-2E family transporter [Calditrichaceae bacterium]
MNRVTLNQVILILVVLLISALFITMIQQFLMVILISGIFAAMLQPVYQRFNRWFKGRNNLSSAMTLLFICFVVLLPFLGILGLVAGQAVKISKTVKPWIEERIEEPGVFSESLQSLPFYDTIQTYRDVIMEKGGEVISKLSTILFESVSTATFSTFNFFFLFFIFLYVMFFFLKDGRLILEKILYYLPLTDRDETRLLERFTSVTRATVKGTLVIGIIQGGLAGLAFWIFGIDNALFWGTIMVVLSIIPVVGSAIVWIPAVIILLGMGQFGKAIGLALVCGVIVGSVDNLLRPRLVGKDSQMHELLILLGTLGGISLFGIIGFIVGPIIAALFVTVWDIYGETFKEYLPEVKFVSTKTSDKGK